MGRKLVLMSRWDAEEAMRLIEREKVTYFVGVPLMSLEMLNHPRRSEYDLSTVTDFAAGGAPRPVEHVRRIKTEMGGPKGGGAPLLGYGLTETNGIGCGNWRDNYLAKPNSTGRASAPLVDLAILDNSGRPVAQGERGEIGIRSVANFKEYWGRPEATAAAFTAGAGAALVAVFLAAFGTFLAPETYALRSVPARNRGIAVALARLRSPVLGLRTIRAERCTFSKTPKPVMVTFSPVAVWYVIVWVTALRARAASALLPSK
jgi:acyl-CoA synthetase (AMP-forming)/AMP-acid ligase II